MGRRALPVAQKAVKTKRQSRAMREAAERAAAAAAIAALPVGTTIEPPAELRAAHFADALAIWRDLGPELERTNRLQPIHRLHFAMFCIYLAEWWQACADLAEHGRAQKVKTVAGGFMERDRPAVRQRAEAWAAAKDAAVHFGLTPTEEYRLFKDQSVVARENPSLFNRADAAADTSTDEAPAAAAGSSIGSMARFKSAPPETTH